MVAVLASSFAVLFGSASAGSTTTYTLTGFVDQPGAAPVPAGVTVDLVARATGTVYSVTTTGTGGEFSFNSSSTATGLSPGYWGLYVPPAANTSLTGCKRCAVLPQQQNPVYKYYNATVLTNANYTQLLSNVSVVRYNAAQNGTVTLNGTGVQGAQVEVLAPNYAGLDLVSNTTNATGIYNLSVPFGTWILQVSYSSGGVLYSNTSKLVITTTKPAKVNPELQAFSISGRILTSATKPPSYVRTPGNATLYDPTNGYLYTQATPPGGYYAFPSYAGNFSHGNQNFTVILAASGYEPGTYATKITADAPTVFKNVTVAPLGKAQQGTFDTLLNFSTINPATGKGTLGVSTDVALGNDSVIPDLPNASVGQLWAQLGLDYNHSLVFDASKSGAALQNFIGSQGPFFPAVQAGATVNGTSFVRPPTTDQQLTAYTSTCATYCGLGSAASITYSWSTSYTLNGSVPINATSYVLSFGFAHPVSSADVYNYTIDLPAHYVLYANTSAPSQTALVGKGPSGTWTAFTLESKWSATTAATASFTIVREANLTANVAISSTNSSFSSANILNDTHKGYTVVLGVGMNTTFSAAPSVYPEGLNGTEFKWNFGDGTKVTVSNVTTNHTYKAIGPDGGKYPYNGSLEILSSSGLNNTTNFTVWVINTVPTAGIASNATAAQNKTSGGVKYLFINWSTTLHFNATATVKTTPNNISIAYYTLKARNYTTTANYSVAKGASAYSNWTMSFGSNTTSNITGPGHGVYIDFSTVEIGGVPVTVKGHGWIYNLTLTVWSLVGTSSVAHLTILVNDTEPPVSAFSLMNSAGKPITSGSITENSNHIAIVRLNATASVSYGNGSLTYYNWTVNNTNTTNFKNFTWSNTSLKPNGVYPTLRLAPKTTDYTIKLTVTSLNGIKNNSTQKLEVAENTTIRPLMYASNLTGPSTVNAGSSYQFWVNISNKGGVKSTALTVTVSFYLLSSSGTGSKNYIAGTPNSVVFYGYSNNSTNATLNTTSEGTGSVAKVPYGVNLRAIVTWTPGTSGSFILYAYATATNQFVNNSSSSIASTPITVHPNPTTQLLEYGGIAAAAVIVLLVIVILVRRRGRKPTGGSKSSSSSSSKSGLERSKKDDDDDDDA